MILLWKRQKGAADEGPVVDMGCPIRSARKVLEPSQPTSAHS